MVDTYYDSLDQVSQQSRPHKENEAAQLVAITYDILGRPIKVDSPDGSSAENFYNESTRPNVASGGGGQTVRTKDAWGRERWERADARGRLVEVVEPDPNGNGTVSTGGLVTTYQYDALIICSKATRAARFDIFDMTGWAG